MKFENTEVWGFEDALRGMRNPKESWDKSDSGYKELASCPDKKYCENCNYDACAGSYDSEYIIGPNDMKLAVQLIRAGSEHRKFMRQIFVSVDITAPLYWWKEFDTYKVGTVANSTSTMHKMASRPITLDCFEIGDLNKDLLVSITPCVSDVLGNFDIQHDVETYLEDILEFCECLRQKYLETNDKRYWKELIRWLPESWLQTRTVTMSYENLLAMCSKGQRRFHKLNEWSGKDNPELPNFITWARTLPYAQEFIFWDEAEDLIQKQERELYLISLGEKFERLIDNFNAVGNIHAMPAEEIKAGFLRVKDDLNLL